MTNRHQDIRDLVDRVRVRYPYRWRGHTVTDPGDACRRWLGNRWCGRTDQLRTYPVGPLCPDHQPQTSAGPTGGEKERDHE